MQKKIHDKIQNNEKTDASKSSKVESVPADNVSWFETKSEFLFWTQPFQVMS